MGRKKRPAAAAKRPSKRSKSVIHTTLNEDALGLVMEFLAPKELYKMAFTCKGLRDKVTTRVVVRSAIMHGGNARTTINDLYELLKHGAIFMPSPLRLLRLVNGKRCEECLQARVNHTRDGYGVFLCWECLTTGIDKYTIKLQTKKSWFQGNPKYLQIVNHPGVAGRQTQGWTENKNIYAWCRSMVQGEEQCGPRVSHNDIMRIARDSRPVNDCLTELLTVQPGQVEFVQHYEASIQEAHQADAEREEKKRNASKRAADKKLENSLKVVAKIQDLLDEPWRDFALSCTPSGLTGKSPCLEFRQPFINELMRPYVTAPSKAKKAVIYDIASQINRRFDAVSEMEGFDFLDEDDPFQAACKPVFQEKFPTLESLVMQRHFCEKAFDYAEEGNLVDAMIECSGMYSFSSDWSKLLLPQDASDSDKALASYLWSKEFSNNYSRDSLRSENNSKAFVAATASFPAMQAGLQEYFDLLDEKQVEWANAAREYIFNWRHRNQFLDFLYNKDLEGLFTRMAELIVPQEEAAANED